MSAMASASLVSCESQQVGFRQGTSLGNLSLTSSGLIQRGTLQTTSLNLFLGPVDIRL